MMGPRSKQRACIWNDGLVFEVMGSGWKQWACVRNAFRMNPNDWVAFETMGLHSERRGQVQSDGVGSKQWAVVRMTGLRSNHGLVFELTALPSKLQPLECAGTRDEAAAVAASPLVDGGCKGDHYRWQGVLEEAGIRDIVGVVKRVIGSGFDIKGRGGMGTGMPKANLKVEDIEAAARKLGPPLLLVSY